MAESGEGQFILVGYSNVKDNVAFMENQ